MHRDLALESAGIESSTRIECHELIIPTPDSIRWLLKHLLRYWYMYFDDPDFILSCLEISMTWLSDRNNGLCITILEQSKGVCSSIYCKEAELPGNMCKSSRCSQNVLFQFSFHWVVLLHPYFLGLSIHTVLSNGISFLRQSGIKFSFTPPWCVLRVLISLSCTSDIWEA